MVSMRTAIDSDIESFKLSPDDNREAWEHYGLCGRDVLRYSFETADECWVGKLDGEVFCIFGCRRLSEDGGANLWMLFADGLDVLPLQFFKKSKAHVQTMLKNYGQLSGRTNPANISLIRWLRWLGFTVAESGVFHLGGDD